MNPLIADLSSPDPLVRERAAIKLEFARVPETAAVEPLIVLLNAPENRVQIAAAGALGVMRDDRAVAPLLKMFAGDTYLTSEGADSPEQYFRVVKAAAWALALIAQKSEQYETIFWTFLHRLAWHDADQSPHLRAEAAAAAFGLGWLHDGRAKSVLLEAAQYGAGRVKEEVIYALWCVRDQSAKSILLDALNVSSEYRLVGNAARSLGIQYNVDTIPALIAVVERDDDRFVVDLPPRQHKRMKYVAARYIRLRAGWALGQFYSDHAEHLRAAFERWITSSDRTLREAAAMGLTDKYWNIAPEFQEITLNIVLDALKYKDDENLAKLLEAVEMLGHSGAIPILEELIAKGHAPPYHLEWMRQIVRKLSQ